MLVVQTPVSLSSAACLRRLPLPRRCAPRFAFATSCRALSGALLRGVAFGEPRNAIPQVSPQFAHTFPVYFTNARSFNSMERRGILQHDLDVYKPDLFGIVETWLSSDTPRLVFDGYIQVCRRDRPGCSPGTLKHGGIIFRRINGVVITHLLDSDVAERSWCRVCTNLGPFLLGLWYRSPNATLDHISSMKEEDSKLANGMVGILVVGDLKIWHKRWLAFSPSNSAEGDLLYEIACELNMKQLVDKPTHDNGNLLDLVLSSLLFCASRELTSQNCRSQWHPLSL